MAGKDAFSEVIEDWAGRMSSLRTYTVTGVRPDGPSSSDESAVAC